MGLSASAFRDRVGAVSRVTAYGALQLAMDDYNYAPAYITEDSIPVMIADCVAPLGC